MIGCCNWLYNRLRVTLKMVDSNPVGALPVGDTNMFCNVDASGGGPPLLNNSIHLAWPKCAVYKKQLFITIIYLRFYQNAMTLSSPRMNGVATICFFSWLPPTKLIKFVTARQQMKRTVGATP